MMAVVDIVADLEKLLTLIPDDIKNAAPTVIPSMGTLITSAVEYVNYQEPLREVLPYLATTKIASHEAASHICSKLKAIPEIANKTTEICEAVQRPEVADPCILDCVEKRLAQGANYALGGAFAVSVVGLCLEAGRLVNFYETICKSKFLVKKEFVAKKAEIERKLMEIRKDIVVFASGLDCSYFVNMSDRQRLKFHVKKTRESAKLREKFDEMHEELGSMTIVVNGQMTQLKSYCNAGIPVAIGNALQGVSLGVNVGLFASVANPVLLVASAVAAVGHFVAMGTGLYLRKKATATIDDLREAMGEITRLRAIVKEHAGALETAFLEFEEKVLPDE